MEETQKLSKEEQQIDIEEEKLNKLSIVNLINDDDLQSKWLVEGMIPCNAITLLSGRTGNNKTTTAEYLSLCLVNGLPFMGKQTKKSKVLYLNYESDISFEKDKLKKLINGNEKFTENKDFLMDFKPGYLLYREELESSKIDDLIKEHEPDVVIIDPLLFAFQGKYTDVDNTAIYMLYGTLKSLSNKYSGYVSVENKFKKFNGITWIIIHHVTKKGAQSGRLKIEDVKGTSDITNLSSTVIVLDKTRKKNAFEIRILKNRYNSKTNMNFIIDYQDDKIVIGDYKENIMLLTKEAEDILQYLQDSNTTMFKINDLVKPLGLTKKQVWKAVRALKDNEIVKVLGRGKNTAYSFQNESAIGK